ncbi:hypothetical protein TNCV_897311 [Trichonephila clavipes]|nr:hypothetical protein TNCV_897311 [Trichonephila clavipes]
MQVDLLPDRLACKVCKGFGDDPESHRNTESQKPLLRSMLQRSRGKEQKQQHIHGTEHIVWKGCTTIGVRNSEQKTSGRSDNGAA